MEYQSGKRASVSFGSPSQSVHQSYLSSPYGSGVNLAHEGGNNNNGNVTNNNSSANASGEDVFMTNRSPMYSPLDFLHPLYSPNNYSQLHQIRAGLNSTLKNMNQGVVCEFSAHFPLYGLDWSVEDYVCFGSYKEDSRNKLQVIHSPDLFKWDSVAESDVIYPVSNIQWMPSPFRTRKLATSSDSLRIWALNPEENTLEEQLNLSLCKFHKQHPNNKAFQNAPNYPTRTADINPSLLGEFPPITSFHWNPIDTNILISSSIDTTCIVWDLQSSNYVKTQLIAHDSEVFDVRFLTQSTQLFASCGGDGSVRVFDLRCLAHSTIIYEPSSNDTSTGSGSGSDSFEENSNALLRLEPSPHDPNVLATFAIDSTEILILDMRNPESPLVVLDGHSSSINQIKWHPTKKNTLISCSDDCQVLCWDINSYFEDGSVPANTPRGTNTSMDVDADGDYSLDEATSMTSSKPSKQTLREKDLPMMYYSNKNQEINNIVWRPQRGDWFGCVSGKKFQNVRTPI
ncbi:hypothetical protein RNJ44_01276 [Nakaseomyces bracarensis]|uniref:Uncharacterized protein n=1 Tax=Nakaseomyces bracarensis TaxID=273131 RepID=A0ABR4NRI5_9SACH